ncbi:replication-associated recombination protein A [Tenacibaculum finnmarkense genomovar finnmarkense]|uniref:Replication-associated recombination protein A n=1 Tax=Tenacibaculum finnmarkense genomovar finnmarkense TaxID=1458503 RepID=A0AAP1RG48_9FLAO|nr:replication-associated recombination protein A [Tenacibaculum finnmarkense]MBE7653294.1 AAA family ATPase [Tenacibaculum finnmarkense genomovar finnmarkense]MBE7661208.1 AAA family ATPase [Tenacibaculum finnmarkense genomovar finnmarkense]MBE7693568.1 AAA family ATPase [Tenacibaculum finnmarkense genomovar finnmarkense]MBE7695595.1 AAA family ATPase [Tenacibaculum finnmarkense genomovar finnmarkense]MCD8403673.1 replication-associated recombination protein A [Tenacibaculum finnmarkense geno
MNQPLAERIRPQNLSDYISQQHLVGENGILTNHIKQGIIPSLILWGPPGIGKTTLANIIANESGRPFYTLSAISAGVKDVREIIEKAKKSGGLFSQKNPILFIDEIHRFSKSQQDSLLGAVEKGWVTLIGATTENPSFEVIPALLSRCQVYILNSFDKNDLIALLHRAMKKDTFIADKKITLKETDALLQVCGGDARKLLNIFELLVAAENEIEITNELVLSKIQKNTVRYDKTGEQHYDIASAFIKSIRGSDPNAAVYWLARMIEGGEDVKFIARRMLIAASEDIGNANPTAFIMANNTFQAVSVIGYPESRIILSQCAIYLANSPKSNASYMAIGEAQNLVKTTGDLPIPLHLRNAPTKLMKDLNYGKDYAYSHNYTGNFVNQEFLPEEIKNTKLYEPGNNARENQFRELLKQRWKDKYKY